MKKHIAATLALSASLVATAQAAPDTDFYKGKTLTYIVATNPGGGYDTYGRLIGKYLEEHLGLDKVLVKNIPGAGHIIGANTLWASKPDGLTLGTFNTGLIYGQILGRDTMRFDLREFDYIGKAASDPRALVISKECEYQSFEEIKNADEPVKFAVSGIGSASYTDTQLLAEALDLDVDVITGFNGTEGEMSMMRGEVCAQVGSASSLKGFVDAGHGSYGLVVGGDIEGVPNAMEYADTDRAKQIVSLIDAMAQLGRITAAPPDTPPERLEALRDAYEASLNDPDLLKEAKTMGRPIDPARGKKVHDLVNAALNQSPETVEVIARAVNVEAPTVTVTSDLSFVSDDGRWIEFMSGDEKIRAKISGSRTTVKIDDEKAKRSSLEKGMGCEIEYAPGNSDNEPKSVLCQKG